MTIKQSAKQALFQLLDELPDGTEFPGIYLQKTMLNRTGEMHYPDTFLRYLRMYRKEKGRQIINIDRARSRYLILEA